jgi:hypothetical protein
MGELVWSIRMQLAQRTVVALARLLALLIVAVLLLAVLLTALPALADDAQLGSHGGTAVMQHTAAANRTQ